MARKQDSARRRALKAEVEQILAEDRDLLKSIVAEALQQTLEAEMDEALGAEKSERTTNRVGYRSGYYGRTLVTRVGKIELRVPQDRQGRFRTEVFERYQRSEKALTAAMMQMYLQGVSTRKVKAITEELCGHEFSSASISRIVAALDEELEQFSRRRLEEDYPYLVLDARYEKVREDGSVRSQAVLIAIGIDWEGRRNVLAVEVANRESASSWKDFLSGLRERGLHGVQFAVSDDHPGLKRAIREVLPEADWQRCYVHFLRNALDYLPRKANDDCLTELRWLYDRRNLDEARRDLAAWLGEMDGSGTPNCAAGSRKTSKKRSASTACRGEHHKNLKSTNMLERIMEEIKRRTLVVRIFPNTASCLRLVRALAVEMHENWIEAIRYLNMEPLRDQNKDSLRRIGEAA